MTNTLVLDLETDALENYSKVWVAVTRDLTTDKTNIFRNLHEKVNLKEFIDHLQNYNLLIGHNIIGFDLGVLDFLGVPNTFEVHDTLVVSKLLNYKQDGGHSLESWGERFGVPKSKFNDFSRWSQELEDRCVIDTLLTKRLYNTFSKYLGNPKWKKPIEIEHKVAFLCNRLHLDGFTFDLPKAQRLYQELLPKVEELKFAFAVCFPPKPVPIKEINPKLTKAGTLHSKDFRWLETNDLSSFSADAPFTLIEYEEFNPNSPRQVVERLNAAGWQPTEKTKGHLSAQRTRDKEKLEHYKTYGWTISEENLDTLPETAPEAARKLKEYVLLNSRLSDLEEWIGLVRPSKGDPEVFKIHGYFNHIGAWTHRKSHQKPNMANIPALLNRKGEEQLLGKEFRSLFKASPGKVLVGCDAEGIQLRVFAHYTNDKKLIEAIVNGKKEDGTDIHTLNKGILGTICSSRSTAKTYIYALFLGAQTAKQSQILGCSRREAEEGIERILDFYPGWKKLKEEQIKADADRGYFEGFDGRLVMIPDERLVLAGYLQNGESVIMKYANLLWKQQLEDMGVPFVQVNDVHDEWQTETLPEYADIVGKTQIQSFVTIGEQFGLNCPLAGNYVIGKDWSETH